MPLEPLEFEKLPSYKPDYEHIKCRCGGTIGAYNRENFTCERCGKGYEPYQLEYDHILINDKTGWMFPVKNKED